MPLHVNCQSRSDRSNLDSNVPFNKTGCIWWIRVDMKQGIKQCFTRHTSQFPRVIPSAALQTRWNMLQRDVCVPLCNCLHWVIFPKKHVAGMIERGSYNLVLSKIRAFINMRQPNFPFRRLKGHMRTLKLGPESLRVRIFSTWSEIFTIN